MDHHGKQTSSQKGNDRSPESNVPRSNMVFAAIKAYHSTWPIKQVLKKTDLLIIHKLTLTSSHFKKHINGPWKPEAQNRTRPSFNACLGYQQPTPMMLHIKFDQDWPTGFRDIQVRKCERRTTTDHLFTISSPCFSHYKSMGIFLDAQEQLTP